LQPEIRVEKLQRGAQKYALQQLDPEDFEVRGMEGAQLSPAKRDTFLLLSCLRLVPSVTRFFFCPLPEGAVVVV
jgi:hypothetical protein